MNASNHRRRRSAAWRRSVLFSIFVISLVGLAAGLAAPTAYSAPRSACWEDRFYLGFQDTFAGPIATAGMRAFVAGAGRFGYSPGSQAAVHVRAYNIAARHVLWEGVWQPVPADSSPVGIAYFQRVVVVAAHTGLNSLQTEYNNLALRAYASGNGHVLWTDRCLREVDSSGPPSGPHDALLAFGNNAVVAGNCDPNDTGTSGGLLRAYNAVTGAVAWQVFDSSVVQLGIARDSTRVFDLVSIAPGSLALRAYDGASGALLWETAPVTPAGTIHITAGANRVFVSISSSSGGVTTRTLIAFQANSGTEAWEVDPGHDVQSMAESQGQLFLAQSGNGSDAFARAYNALTGTLLWEHIPGSATDPYFGQAVATGSGIVLFAGTRYQMSSEDTSHLIVRAYSPDGTFLWEQGEPTTAELSATARDVAWVNGFSILSGMAGHETAAYGVRDWVVRVCGPEPVSPASLFATTNKTLSGSNGGGGGETLPLDLLFLAALIGVIAIHRRSSSQDT